MTEEFEKDSEIEFGTLSEGTSATGTINVDTVNATTATIPSISASTSVTSPNFIGNASTATALESTRYFNGQPFNGTQNVTIPISGTTENPITFSNTGNGTTSVPYAWNGGVPVTVSYNTIGANQDFTKWTFYAKSGDLGDQYRYTPECYILPFRDINPTTYSGSNVSIVEESPTGTTNSVMASITNNTGSDIYMSVYGYMSYENTTTVSGRTVSMHLLASPFSYMENEPYADGSQYPPYVWYEIATQTTNDESGGGGLSCSGVVKISSGTTIYIYSRAQVRSGGGNFDVERWGFGGTRIA